MYLIGRKNLILEDYVCACICMHVLSYGAALMSETQTKVVVQDMKIISMIISVTQASQITMTFRFSRTYF